jgi:hypothetical protein
MKKKNTEKFEEFESYIKEVFEKELPVTFLDNGSILYKSCKLKIDKNKKWGLYSTSSDLIDTFYLKATALLAAKNYHKSNLKQYLYIKDLDHKYNQSATDTVFFKHYKKTTKDLVKRDVFTWRYEISLARAKQYKAEIASLFKNNF